MTDDELLEAELAEPIESLVARAERRAYGPTGHVEFNLTFVQHGEVIHRQNAAHFIAQDDQLILTDEVAMKAPRSGQVTVQVREPQSDVVIANCRVNAAWINEGDTLTMMRGSVRIGVPAF